MIDQQGYHDLLDEAVKVLTYLQDRLGSSYDELCSQDVDIEDLGNAVDGIIFANQKIQEQKIKLEAYRKELKSKISSTYGEKE